MAQGGSCVIVAMCNQTLCQSLQLSSSQVYSEATTRQVDGARQTGGVTETRVKDVTKGGFHHAPACGTPLARSCACFTLALRIQTLCRSSRQPETQAKFEDSPISRFSGTVVKLNLNHFHPFGSPVYVLEAALQSGMAHNKWMNRARVGIFLCHSPDHATNVPLILNTQTGLVSPQSHLICNDDFDTIKRDTKSCSLWQLKAKIHNYQQSYTSHDVLPTFSDRSAQRLPTAPVDPKPTVQDMFLVPWADAEQRQQHSSATTTIESRVDNLTTASDDPELSTEHRSEGSTQQTNAPDSLVPTDNSSIEDTSTPTRMTHSGRTQSHLPAGQSQDLLPTFSGRQTQNFNPPQADPNICNVFQVPWMDVETRQQPLPAPTIVACNADNVPAATNIPEPSARDRQDGSTQQTDAPIAPIPDTELDVPSPMFSDRHTQNFNPPQADPNICNVFQVPWMDVETRQQPLPAPTIVACDADNVPAATNIPESSTRHRQDGSTQQTDAPIAPIPDTELDVPSPIFSDGHTQNYNPPQADPNIHDIFQVPWTDVETRRQPLPAPAIAARDADNVPAATDISEPSTGHSQDGSMQQTDAPTAPAPDTEIEVEDTASPATRTLSGRNIKQNRCFFDSKVYAFNAFLRNYNPPQADPNIHDIFQVPWTDVETRQQPIPAPAIAARDADNVPAATDISEPSTGHSQDGSMQQTDAPTAPAPDTEIEVEDTASPATRTLSGCIIKQN